MNKPEAIPEPVIKAIRETYSEAEATDILGCITGALRCYISKNGKEMRAGWAYDHYFIERDLGGERPMYVGIELDGYMHT